jgi:H+/gluconate symporter-like permease
MELVYIHGWMEGLTKVLGKIIICMARVFTLGVMAGDMMESTIWIRSMATVFITGQMEEDMRVFGVMASSTERESTSCLMGLQK